MTNDQFSAALKRLKLTQERAGELLHRSTRSVNGYANDKPIPYLVAKEVSEWLKNGLPKG